MTWRVTGALVAAVIACLAAGCGGSGNGWSVRATASACPAAAPSSAAPGKVAGPGGLIKPGPVVVTICQYDSAGSARTAPLRRIVLRGPAAAGLAAVVDSGEPVTGATRRCDRPAQLLPYSQIFVFGYRAGRVSRVAAAQLTCDRAVVTSQGRSAVLGFAAAAGLFAITSVPRHPHGPRTPALIGLNAVTAAGVARHHRFSVSFGGGVVDPAVPFGAVVFQSLPAGVPDSGPGREVDVIVAVRRSPPCVAGQLAVSYAGGEAGAGNDFGTLLIGDRSPRPCTLTGPLHVAGLDRDGHRVTSSVRFPLSGVTVLSPGLGAITRSSAGGALTGLEPGDLTGVLTVRAEYRDGPANVDNGLCAPLWVIPASWRVTLPGGASVVVANVARHSHGLVPSGGFVTCRGRLGVAGPGTVTGSLSG